MPFDVDHVRELLSEDFNSVYEKKVPDEGASFLLPFSTFHLSLRVDNERDVICVRIPQIVNIDEKHKTAVLQKAMDLNYRLILGRFGFDPGDGELVFEIYQVTVGFEGPWKKYDPILRRMIGVAINVGRTDCAALRRMNFTGKWKDAPEEEGAKQESPYEALCIPVRDGKISPDRFDKEDLEGLLDTIIELSLKPERDKLEDYPGSWRELLRRRMDAGTGSEI